MKIDKYGIDLLTQLEGLKTKAYKCTAGVWTIGIGSTYFENGEKVSEGDSISKEEAYRLFELTASKYEKPINNTIKVPINQNQFNALFCFCYNVGATGFKNSTLARKINEGGSRKEIESAFMMWRGKTKNKAGKFVLESRRQSEINEYFKL
jgi:lysozyme